MRSDVRLTLLMLLALSNACGDEDQLAGANPYRPYDDGATTVIGGDDAMPVASGAVTDEGCLQVTEDSCVAVNREGRYCGDSSGPADAIAVDGVVVEVVCYSDSSNKREAVVDTDSDGDIDIPQNENGAVITFDPSTDGKAFVGNVTIDGNNVTLYGNGPDKSIIDGNLVISGNNARVRGIRVKGNVTIELNTGALILSVVEGNLHVNANNSLVAEVDVLGNLEVKANNTILVGNGVQGNWKIEGSGSSCERNFHFSDGNGDKIFADGEKGEALACP